MNPNDSSHTHKVTKGPARLTRVPIVGVCSSNADLKSVQEMEEKLLKRGVEIRFLSDSEDRDAAKDLAMLDGLVIMGDDDFDIDPQEYSEKKVHKKTNIVDPARARYRNELINGAMEKNIPLLGICAGMQRINILNHEQDGGTLIQHVPDELGNSRHMQPENITTPVLPITIRPDTLLARIAHGLKTIFSPDHAKVPGMATHVNTLHHQAVGVLRDGFIYNAISDDGIIMGFEPDPNGQYAGKPILGVQFHPERLNNEVSTGIIDLLVDWARDHAIHRRLHESEAVTVDMTESLHNASWQQRKAAVSPIEQAGYFSR